MPLLLLISAEDFVKSIYKLSDALIKGGGFCFWKRWVLLLELLLVNMSTNSCDDQDAKSSEWIYNYEFHLDILMIYFLNIVDICM